MVNYTEFGDLNDDQYDLDADMKPIGPSFTIDKVRAETPLELELAGTVQASSVDAFSIRFEVRVNGQVPDFKIQGRLLKKAPDENRLYDSIYTKSVYTDLPIGNYTCQVYAKAAAPEGGTATVVVLDPGGYGDVILATEY